MTRTDNDAEDKPRMSDKKDACFSSFHYSPFPSWLRVTCSLLRPYFRFGPCWLIVPIAHFVSSLFLQWPARVPVLGAPPVPLPMVISLAYLSIGIAPHNGATTSKGVDPG